MGDDAALIVLAVLVVLALYAAVAHRVVRRHRHKAHKAHKKHKKHETHKLEHKQNRKKKEKRDRSESKSGSRSIGSKATGAVAARNVWCGATWMADLTRCTAGSAKPFGQRTLQQMTIPGSHDSGTYSLSGVPAPGATTGSTFGDDMVSFATTVHFPLSDITTPWATAQTVNITKQLEAGVRFLDLRAAWDGIQWRVYHFVLGNNLVDLLQQVAAFLQAHAGEVVVVEIGGIVPGFPPSALANLTDIITRTFGSLLWGPAGSFVPLDAMVAANRRAIVLLDDNGSDPATFCGNGTAIWRMRTYLNNTYSGSDNVADLLTYANAQAAAYRASGPLQNPPRFSTMTWTHTPDTSTIVEGELLFWEPDSLLAFEAAAIAQLPIWLAAQPPGPLSNVFMTDSSNTSPWQQLVAKCNTS